MSTSDRSDLAITNPEIVRYNPVMQDWNSLLAESDKVLGYDLAKEDTLNDLTGIPFIITRMQFRPGVMRPTGEMDKETKKPVLKRGAYVTCELALSPASMLVPTGPDTIDEQILWNLTKINAARKASKLSPVLSLAGLSCKPGDLIVMNDGSTGIYRQCVEYLASKGYISLHDPVVPGGPMGQSSYDAIPTEWKDIHAGEMRFDIEGFGNADFNTRLYAPRGIRVSEFENEYTAPGEPKKTRYLA